jgi:hypothetical protein
MSDMSAVFCLSEHANTFLGYHVTLFMRESIMFWIYKTGNLKSTIESLVYLPLIPLVA